MAHEKHEKHEQGIILRDEAFQIQGAIFEVSRTMGCGFLEAVYHECLAFELEARGIPFVSAPVVRIDYKGRELRQAYVPDLICYEQIILELKATRELVPEHRSQVLNYLNATKLRLGLLVNFGCAPKARVERIVL